MQFKKEELPVVGTRTRDDDDDDDDDAALEKIYSKCMRCCRGRVPLRS